MSSPTHTNANPYAFFVAVEGLDGSGKTTFSRRLAEHFAVRLTAPAPSSPYPQPIIPNPQSLIWTYEPHNDYAAGAYIRQVLTRDLHISPYGLALAYALNRIDHVERGITPFLDAATSAAPRALISDRYYLSSLAYQPTPEFSIADVMHLNRAARVPDLHLYLDVDAETAYTRIGLRGKTRELFDGRLEEMRARYAAAIAYLHERGETVITLDARSDANVVFAAALHMLDGILPAWLR